LAFLDDEVCIVNQTEILGATRFKENAAQGLKPGLNLMSLTRPLKGRSSTVVDGAVDAVGDGAVDGAVDAVVDAAACGGAETTRWPKTDRISERLIFGSL
jgi:hypothetical protein